MAYHVIRNGRSPLWLMALAIASFSGAFSLLATLAVWFAYLAFAVIPDIWNSAWHARASADNVVKAADPGRDYREKQRQVELVGSVDAKRALAEECIKRGRFTDAVELYESAMQGPLGRGRSGAAEGIGARPTAVGRRRRGRSACS